jgi:hypothetical protein
MSVTVGFPVSAIDINNRAGQLVVQLRDDLERVKQFAAWLNDATTTDAFLNAAGLTGSVSSGDVQTLRAAFTDLLSLYNVAHGTASTGVNDFFFNAKHLTGVV